MPWAGPPVPRIGRLITLLEILQVHADRYAQCVSLLQSAANKVLQFEDFWEDDTTFVPGLLQWLILLDEMCEKDELPVTRVLVTEVKGMIEIALNKDLPYAVLSPVLLTKDVMFQHLERIRLTFT